MDKYYLKPITNTEAEAFLDAEKIEDLESELVALREACKELESDMLSMAEKLGVDQPNIALTVMFIRGKLSRIIAQHPKAGGGAK